MNILVSNDDGCQSTGIRCLVKTLSGVGKVTVVAPDRDRSGASNSLTLDGPIRVTQRRENIICVDGTPTDCVHLAITGLLEQEPDMVVSGINAGGNLGDDVLYSGTVAAAMEGRFLGFPAIAVSLVSDRPTHYDTAARAVVELIARMQQKPVPSNTILNVNVPDRPWEELAGFQATRLGHRHKSEPVIRMEDPRGRPIYWVGPAGAEQDAGAGTDFNAVRSGYISVSPIHVDLTRYDALDIVSGWLEGEWQ
ncbi:MAG: 5'/3'-nucleotidase SurE [Gammaproteobacteria bacterium]